MPVTIDTTIIKTARAFAEEIRLAAPAGFRLMPAGITLPEAEARAALRVLEIALEIEAKRRRVAGARGGRKNKGRQRHDVRSLTPRQERALVRARERGTTETKLMARFGISKATLYRALRRGTAEAGDAGKLTSS